MLPTLAVSQTAWFLLLMCSMRLAESACALPSAIGRKLALRNVVTSINTAITRRMLVVRK